MLALDTNALVRVLIDDPSAAAQCRSARAAVAAAGNIHVCQIVQVETVWVLASAYGLDKSDLLHVLETVANHPAFHLQRRETFLAALRHYREGHADFADCLILAESAAVDCPLATFDRKLGKLPGTQRIE